MPGREYECEVTRIVWLTPNVFSLSFAPSRHFRFDPGQFASVLLPVTDPTARPAHRIYSFSSAGKSSGYELCVQLVPGGRGSSYLASLKPGDQIRVSAPYGDFRYETPPERNACFIATGTGIGPFKSIATSESFRAAPPADSLLLLGVREERDILFPGVFESAGVPVVHCLSKPSPTWAGFTGRVTDYLRSLPASWPWRETDFYLCGSGLMIEEVNQLLLKERQVLPEAIRQEAYFSTTHVRKVVTPAETERKKAA